MYTCTFHPKVPISFVYTGHPKHTIIHESQHKHYTMDTTTGLNKLTDLWLQRQLIGHNTLELQYLQWHTVQHRLCLSLRCQSHH